LINTLKAKIMGHIKEPQGVDFIIQSKPLTDEERTAISEYIRNYKAKQKVKRSHRTTRAKSNKTSA
jgi:hypothetical protein